MLGRPRSRWENQTEMDLKERRWGVSELESWARDRDQLQAFLKTVMNIWSINDGGFE